MLREREISELMSAVSCVVRDLCAPLVARLNSLEGRPVPAVGEQGPPGARGKSAYELAVERGFTGTELQWLDSLSGKAGESIVGPPGERGADGKDAPAPDTEAIATSLLAKMPTPKDGRDGADGMNGKDGADGLPGKDGAPGIQGKDGKDGEPGRDGINGKDGAPGEPGAPSDIGQKGDQGERGADGSPGLSAYQIAVTKGYGGTELEWLDALRGKQGDAGPAGRDGRDGIPGDRGEKGSDGLPGRDANPGHIKTAVAEQLPALVTRAQESLREYVNAALPTLKGATGEAGPAGRDGAPGGRGEDGRDGKDGADGKSVTVDDVRPLIDEYVTRSVGAIPTPKDGVSVTLEDVRPLLEAETARWQLEFERRASDTLQRVIEATPKPKDGKDGQDAVQLDGFDMNLEGRTFTFMLRAGDRVFEKQLRAPIPLYQGVFRSGSAYEHGDVVTHSGSLWIAMRNTATSPPSDDWKQCVKKGRDGKDAQS